LIVGTSARHVVRLQPRKARLSERVDRAPDCPVLQKIHDLKFSDHGCGMTCDAGFTTGRTARMAHMARMARPILYVVSAVVIARSLPCVTALRDLHDFGFSRGQHHLNQFTGSIYCPANDDPLINKTQVAQYGKKRTQATLAPPRPCTTFFQVSWEAHDRDSCCQCHKCCNQ
jgi:hypothetical protein